MIVENQTIIKTWSKQNKKRFTNCGCEFTHYGDEFEVSIAYISPKSTTYVKVICDYCIEPYFTQYGIVAGKERHCCNNCRGLKVIESLICQNGSLMDLYPDMCREWNFTKNEKLPSQYTHRSNDKVWWKCSEGHVWEAAICNRTLNNNGCPYCSGRKASETNNFKIEHPKLCNEWDYNKNGSLMPEHLTPASHFKVWWICDKNHSYQQTLSNRTQGNGCPYCARKKVCTDNCLLVTHPALCEEWSNKNKLTPSDVLYGSGKKILWVCKKCSHEWTASINARASNDNGCPRCNESKGEKAIREYLNTNGINYVSQFRISKCRNKKPLPFDFAVFLATGKLFCLIEFDGEQHESPREIFGGDDAFKCRIKNDNIKNEYCIKNNITLIRISYRDIGKVSEILNEAISPILSSIRNEVA